MKATCSFLASLAAILFGVGYFGHLHPALDSIAIGRWVAVYAFLFFLSLRFLLGQKRVLVVGPIIVVAWLSIFPLGPIGEDGPVRIYTKNLLYLNTDIAPIVEDIRKTAPDVVVLQEISSRNRMILKALQTDFPHQAICPWEGWNGMAVLARWPLATAEPRCSEIRALMGAKIARPEGAFWMIGAHLQHPWPDIQWPLLKASLPVIERLDAPAVVSGDFNTLYWTAAAQTVGLYTDTQPIRTKRATYRLWGLALHLDHVWARGGRAHVRPFFGSDHRGVVADIWP